MLTQLGMDVPLIQAPMAGVSTPALAAAVCNAGALGSIGVGATDANGAAKMMADLKGQTDRAFNVNVFAHAAPVPDPARENAWLDFLAPHFAKFGATPPKSLRVVYKSILEDDDMVRLLLAERPAVVSFHFGLPSQDVILVLKQAGITLFATATSPAEAQQIERAGIDAIIAQGIEAGGHRGMFDPTLPDDGLGTFALVRLLVRQCKTPVIAAGGIMDGAGIAAALKLGAMAAQLGTAFISCPESAADDAYRAALMGDGAYHTRLTSLISGRPARALSNRFTALEDEAEGQSLPDYPIAYDAGKALHAAAKAKGEFGFGAQWAGQGAPLSRAMPAAELVKTLMAEMKQAGVSPL
ncbi:nitronate monooxygenase family protein [Thalassospira sp. TSL5-1]|uniref:NAD(P)H-dependent flavin oxidoreductase n=1 Tax=Thalassospira sp. TSL5-1 TaxID=1544451 RepID=UPI0009391595|nr:nitronate monooxygenase [Thalassospira sp. TSL5-1]OKH89463.1 2-nitropropane dioxygenase [Thalassospira sp. TSL5-1]